MPMPRRVDWSIILGPNAPVPRVVNRFADGEMASLLAAFDAIRSLDDSDAILKRAVEVAREQIGLARVGLFLLDGPKNFMLGTWGTDLNGALVDEHDIMYEVSDTDREAFRRAEEESAHFTVFDNCPIVDHRPGATRIGGRSWVACTPIRSARARIGMLFNDTGLTGVPVDQPKQMRVAMLCSLLGAILEPSRGGRVRYSVMGRAAARHPMVTATLGMLAKDPSMGGSEIAAKLSVSLSRLARVFKVDTGMSLVEYRNRLRLERFNALMDEGATNLLDAALSAGFGSYAQFYRVFRASRCAGPREFLRRGEGARAPVASSGVAEATEKPRPRRARR